MILDQRTRGPDGEGIIEIRQEEANVCLGHNRLAIIDLSAAAAQPMRSTDGRFTIVFNGEIFNYVEVREELRALGVRFTTASDTEVLVAAWTRWGSSCLDRLNGMFAFALHDRDDRVVHLVRDRFGVKPLYYVLRNEALYFASTPRALRVALGGLAPDLQYVSRGLRYQVFEDDTSHAPYSEMRAVPSGERLEIRVEGGRCRLTPVRYYNLAARVAAMVDRVAATPDRALIDELSALLQNAVDIRFRADVPVGLSLSGGLDSSSVTAAASLSQGDLRGFSFGHPTEAQSEGPLVAEVAARCGVRMTWIPSAQGSELRDNFWATIDAQDAPFPDSSIIAQQAVFRAVRTEGVKVLLGGQGGDEALMGYHKYRVFQMQSMLAARRPLAALRAMTGVIDALARSPLSPSAVWDQVQRYGTKQARPRFGLPAPEAIDLGADRRRPLWWRQAADVLCLSLPTLLRFEDRNSMGNSVESRLPFMDYRVIELGLALPDGLKLRGGWTKWALRELMAGRVPDSIRVSRVKRPFDANLAHGVRTGLGDEIRQGLGERQRTLREALGTLDGMTPGDFTDTRLVRDSRALGEAVALLWLGSRI